MPPRPSWPPTTPACRSSRGVHLEGPFLSPLWPGAHDPVHFRTPEPGLAARLVNAGPVRTMTIAPELPGGLELTAQLAEAGLVVSCGHSDADAPTAHAAFDRGALRPGAPAHLTVIDDELRVVRTLVGGVEAFGRG